MSDSPSVMSGHIRRQGSGLVGVITDVFGIEQHVVGVAVPGSPGEWSVTVRVVIPDGLKVAFLDDEVGP
jgi:hypothetical protein